MYIVSACLLGANCKYNGGNNDNEAVKDFCEGHKVMAVCPETAGGLKSPRPPAEQVKDRVVNKNGDDLTEYFIRGAEICMEKVMACCGSPERESSEISKWECSAESECGCSAESERGCSAESERGCSDEPELAILKANSPSCGSGQIYDGTFTGTLINGDGVFAKMLKERGIKVVSETDLEKRLAEKRLAEKKLAADK